MKVYIYKILLVVLLSLSCIFIAHAESISDFSTDTFISFSKEVEKRAPASPFATQGVSTAEDLALEDLMLFGTALNDGLGYALISGYLVEEGDSIAGFNVESIEKGKVTLRRLDEVYLLTMGGF